MSIPTGVGFRLLFDRSDPFHHGDLDAAALVELYRHPTGTPGAGWLRTNFVATVDGAISGPDGRSGSINTVSDHHLFALHRALADVILVGAQTVRTEGYQAVDLADWQRDVRRDLGLRPFPTLAVITATLRVEPTMIRTDGAHGPVLIITTPQPADRLRPFRDAGAEIVEVPAEHGSGVPLAQAVTALLDRGLPRILSEGGPRLHRDLLAGDLVDELSLSLAPTAVGGSARRTTDGPALPRPPALQLEHVVHGTDDTVFLSYRRTAGQQPPASPPSGAA